MYRDYPGLDTIGDDEKVWRYMDFTKFVSLLEKQALFFPTVELLRKNDPWEASFQNFEFDQAITIGDETSLEMQTYGKKLLGELASKHVPVSCWHLNQYESDAMWRLYLSANEGVAIQTSLGNLRKCFLEEHPLWPKNLLGQKVPVVGVKVEYIVRDPGLRIKGILKQFAVKGKSFESEQEVRILAQLHPTGTFPHFKSGESGEIVEDEDFGLSPDVANQIKQCKGVYVPVNLDILINTIYVPPFSLEWFTELVTIMLRRYRELGHLSKEIKVTCSDEQPPY